MAEERYLNDLRDSAKSLETERKKPGAEKKNPKKRRKRKPGRE
jgi:hypothetical protein